LGDHEGRPYVVIEKFPILFSGEVYHINVAMSRIIFIYFTTESTEDTEGEGKEFNHVTGYAAERLRRNTRKIGAGRIYRIGPCPQGRCKQQRGTFAKRSRIYRIGQDEGCSI
jgi:hypothetical protein